MTTAVQSMHSEFAAIVGDARLVSDPAACQSFAVDGRAPGSVVYPQSAEQVAAVLKCAADHSLAILPCRNLTKIGVGNPPRRYDVALSLKEMNQVWHYEPADLTISVEAGMKLGDFEHLVGRHGLWLPLDPAGGARASIGGILAANSNGPLRAAYGGPRDMVLGMKIATTQGKVVKTGGRVVKNVTGYDIAKLLIGSYGTLGVIVEASFKLYPRPAERATFVMPLATLVAARQLRGAIQRSHLQPLRLVLMDGAASALVRAAPPGNAEASDFEPLELWIEAGGSPRVIERYARELEVMSQAARTKVVRVETGAQERWDRIADFATWMAESFPDAVILKVSLPIARTEEFLDRARSEAQNRGQWLASVSLTSVGVVRVCLRAERGARELLAPVERLRQTAQGLGGTLVVERCPHQLKPEVDVWGPAGDDFEVMRKLKEVWDPKGVLAPGRFVGGL